MADMTFGEDGETTNSNFGISFAFILFSHILENSNEKCCGLTGNI